MNKWLFSLEWATHGKVHTNDGCADFYMSAVFAPHPEVHQSLSFSAPDQSPDISSGFCAKMMKWSAANYLCVDIVCVSPCSCVFRVFIYLKVSLTDATMNGISTRRMQRSNKTKMFLLFFCVCVSRNTGCGRMMHFSNCKINIASNKKE